MFEFFNQPLVYTRQRDDPTAERAAKLTTADAVNDAIKRNTSIVIGRDLELLDRLPETMRVIIRETLVPNLSQK